MTKEECIALLIRYAEYDGMSILNLAGCKEAMRMAAELLSQPSLPSNLDEAAEDSWAVYEYRESPRGLYSTCYVDGFKAGAMWRDAQIQKLPDSIDEAAEKNFETMEVLEHENIFEETHNKIFKAGAEWKAGQGVRASASVGYYNQCGLSILTEPSIKKLGFEEGDELEIALRKK